MCRAYTLIELLITIAIIAILISVTMPALNNARNQAKGIRCSSNLSSLGQGLHIYANDYNSSIPREIQGAFGTEPYAANLLRSLGYDIEGPQWELQFKDIEIVQCPSFPDPRLSFYPDQTLDYVVNGFSTFYDHEEVDDQLPFPNKDGIGQGDANIWNDGQEKLSDIKNTSSIIYLSEAHRNLQVGGHYILHDVWRGAHLPRGQFPRVAADVRHPGGINSVYFDGHVSRMLPKVMSEKDWL